HSPSSSNALIPQSHAMSYIHAQRMGQRYLPAHPVATLSSNQLSAGAPECAARRAVEPGLATAQGLSDRLILGLSLIVQHRLPALPDAIRLGVGVQHNTITLDYRADRRHRVRYLQPQSVLLHCPLGPAYSSGEGGPQQQVGVLVVPGRPWPCCDIPRQSAPVCADQKPAGRIYSASHHLDIRQLGGIRLPGDEAVYRCVAAGARVNPAVVLISLPVPAVSIIQLQLNHIGGLAQGGQTDIYRLI